MGQQQLLLLVLGIVIVGIAIVVGINAYSENSIKSNFDAVLQDGLRIASDAQSWKQKPEVFGGSPDATKSDTNDFSAVNFVQLSYSQSLIQDGATAKCYLNTNGLYGLTTGADELTIDGVNLSNKNHVQLDVSGVLEANVDLDEANSARGGAKLSDGSTATIAKPTACP